MSVADVTTKLVAVGLSRELTQKFIDELKITNEGEFRDILAALWPRLPEEQREQASNPSRSQALVIFLLSEFSFSEMRQLVPSIRDQLPSHGISPLELAREFVKIAERDKVVSTDAIWSKLREERHHRESEIRAIAALYGVTV